MIAHATRPIYKSHRLDDVCYDIRGPIMERAQQLEAQGQAIIKLNIGNLASFDFDAPQLLQAAMTSHLAQSAGYSDSQGIVAARAAVVDYARSYGLTDIGIEDVFIGNGASELIAMATAALLNVGDEVLIPAPDYPLWTAAVALSGATPVHYRCDEASGWMPDLADLESKINAKSRALVLINPNNPTGAVYSRAVLHGMVELARRHDLVLWADEVYEKVLYDPQQQPHIAVATVAGDVLVLSLGSLSKSHRACGYRCGWMILSGDKARARDYVEGLTMLSNMRLCANVPGQWAIQAALGAGGAASSDCAGLTGLLQAGGRLREQRDLSWRLLNQIPGVHCVNPAGALYMFPRLDPQVYPIEDDQAFFFELLDQKHVMLVPGSGFNWPKPDHFRMVFLPQKKLLTEAIARLSEFLEEKRRAFGTA